MRRLSKYIFGILFVSLILVVVACDGVTRRRPTLKASRADSVLFDVGVAKDYERMRQLADSFEVAGIISPLDANRWRGVSYYHEGHYRMSELYYRKAVECKVENDEDQLSYNKCARRLSELLLVKGDYEGALTTIESGLSLGGGDGMQGLMFNRVVAYERSYDFAKAKKAMDEYLKLYPDDETAVRENVFLSSR